MVADERFTHLKDLLLQPHFNLLDSFNGKTALFRPNKKAAKNLGTRQTHCIVLFLLYLLIRSFH